jgi:putative FmdB family regulatory protein
MPYYDYKCTKCSEIFEIEKGMKEVLKGLSCPKCESSDVNRVFTKPRVLRGTASILDTEGTSGSDCNTCVDGVCDSCSTKK